MNMLGLSKWWRATRCVMLGVLLAAACGASVAAAQRSLRFERLGLAQGLSQESVNSMLQDRHGFMWFGTQAGLNRFDGYRMTVFRNDPADPGSILDNYVTASLEDEQGRLWFGTKGGLTRFDSATQKFVRYLADEPGRTPGGNRTITAIESDGRGGLWLGTVEGLKRFDPDSGRFTTLYHDPHHAEGPPDDRVNALAVDGQGGLWVGRGDGLDRLAPGALRFEHFALGDPAGARPGLSRRSDARRSDARRDIVLALSMGPRDTLWVGTAAGLEAWRLGDGAPQRRRVGASEGMSETRVQTLYHDAGANLWVGTDQEGLKWRDPGSDRFVSFRSEPFDPHSLSDDQVSSILVDRTGTLWAGTLFGGVNRTDLASGGFARLIHVPGAGRGSAIGDGKVRALAPAPGGRLWLGTAGGGLSLWDPAGGDAEQVRHDPARRGSLPDDVITALAMANGRLWVGTPRGLSWRDPLSGQFTNVALGQESNANYVQRLLAARSGTLWIATRAGLFAQDPGARALRSWRHDPRDPSSLGDNYGFALLEDRRGIVWIGTDNGLDRFDPATGQFTHFRPDPADPASLRHNRVFPVTKTQAAAPIGAVLEDRDGMLWASTTLGISRLDPASGQFRSYTAKDGLIDGSYFVGAGLRGADGQLHFGGVGGLTSFRPEAVRHNPFAPAVAITGFSVLNRARALGAGNGAGGITLSQRDSVFTLEFSALHYADPQSNLYAYRLAGFDESWVDTDAGKRFASYTNLDPGSYEFQVRASNKDGIWSETPATLAITITPPWWKTWWFRMLAVLLVLSAAYGGYRLRIRVLVRQKDSLEHEVGTRTAELVLQKEAAERRKHEVEQQKEVVEQAHRNISLLSDIGRRVTSNLDSEAIMETLYAHLHQLMDTGVFGVALLASEGAALRYRFAVVEGKRCAPAEPGDGDPDPLAAWCAGSACDVFIGDLATDYADYLDPAAAPAALAQLALPCRDRAHPPRRSLLYVPIMVGAHVRGVVTVQSFARGAYRRIHLDMLRTLAAYAGIAFDNADAYRQLKDTQAQLAAREKLASLGSLVAGVAHELNTPIGNSLLMASTLLERTDAMVARFEASSLRRSDLAAWIAESQEASSLIMRSLHNAAELVNSFRQVAVDQASAQQRRFELAQACHEIVATLMNRVRLSGHSLELRVPAGIMMDSFPGPLGQVVLNFVNNALLHAFERPGGGMVLSASTPDPGRVLIAFRDDGRGIDAQDLTRIFDPFFTTRMGQGGSGLGLNITYNIVTTLLGGSIRVESGPGQGTAFIVDLPLITHTRMHA
jgi:ligand-binding sensor domain-containing protein/signal transduction histidine kinase